MRALFLPARGNAAVVDTSPAPHAHLEPVLDDLAVIHLEDSPGLLPNLRATLVAQRGVGAGGPKVSGDALLVGWDSESRHLADLPERYVALYHPWLGVQIP